MTSWQIFYVFSDCPGDTKKSASVATGHNGPNGPTFILEMSRVDDFFQQPGSNCSHGLYGTRRPLSVEAKSHNGPGFKPEENHVYGKIHYFCLT